MTGIIYEGPSNLDGQPIVAIATDPGQSRINPKTGPMMPVYILHRDMPPMKANRTGADRAICGACPLKGRPTGRSEGIAEGRGCYVQLHFGVHRIWMAYRAGKYARLRLDDLPAVGKGQTIRLGAYGDPAAVPFVHWARLLKHADNWTGYTHQHDPLGTYMQSVESLADAQRHWSAGRRTFRIIGDVSDLDHGREILCPASPEAGKRTTCAKCNLCRGAAVRAKSIAVVAHGSGRKHILAKMLDAAS